MSEFITKDSGARQEFGTGAVRDIQEGKGRFDLIPTLPIRRLAQLYERGAIKYGDNNWQKGIPLMRYIDSAERHTNNLKSGEPTEDHAIAIVWNLFGYIWTLNEIEHGRLPKELDNRPPPEPQYDQKLQDQKNSPMTAIDTIDDLPAHVRPHVRPHVKVVDEPKKGDGLGLAGCTAVHTGPISCPCPRPVFSDS